MLRERPEVPIGSGRETHRTRCPLRASKHAVDAQRDALLVARRYREAIDSYRRALILAPSNIQHALPLAYTYVGEPEKAIAYADMAMQLSPLPTQEPALYIAEAIAFMSVSCQDETGAR
jgi:tetratricopeptide (TPR) repeat protein